MPKLMADNDVEGQFDALVQFLESAIWKKFWEDAQITVVTFEELGLDRTSPDLLVWETCQAHGIVLFTGSRNQKGTDSLEEAIRTGNRLDSLPVITLGDPIRFRSDGDYAERAAIKTLEYLTDLDQHLGAGRLYVP